MRCWLLAMVLALGMGAPLTAQDDSTHLRPLMQRERQVFERLKFAIAKGDSAAVAGLVVYPLRVNRTIQTRSDVGSKSLLLRRYGTIFTDSVRRAILAQNPDSLFFSWRGTMVGNGEVWIQTVCESHDESSCQEGIVVINLPERRRSRAR